MNKKVLIIVGPTAVGKTEFALKLAERFEKSEIISADSRQIYRYMDIGTAKPTADELGRIKHHFIDIKNPDEYYSAGRFGNDGRLKIDELFSNDIIPIIAGGSGLYIRALVDGFFDRKISANALKKSLKEEIEKSGLPKLYERLKQVDPVSAEKIHPNDGHRIVRALEVFELTGEPLSKIQNTESQPANFQPIFIGLNRDRKALYEIIERRVDKMLELGLVEEVKRLSEMGYHRQLNSMLTVGYREVFDYFEGQIDCSQMIDLIKQRTRNYAKRQLTWFRKDERIQWFNLSEASDIEKIVDNTIEIYKLI